jgi:hypothetical protein
MESNNLESKIPENTTNLFIPTYSYVLIPPTGSPQPVSAPVEETTVSTTEQERNEIHDE